MTEHIQDLTSDPSRRDILRVGLAGLFAVGAGGLLTACTGSGTAPATSTAAGPPKKGGTLTVGSLTGGQSETLDPWAAFAGNDYARVINLYDTLFEFDDNLQLQPALAESGEPSSDKRTWTIRLRDGVTFHDGSSLTADDVIYNIRQWVDPNALFNQQAGYQIDPKQIQKLDARTIRVGLVRPNARFPQDLAFLWGSIKSRSEKKGGHPIGTGPFKYSSFNPGSRSEFVAFANHWRPDPVYLDRLVFDTSFSDENARVNALSSGQIDVAPAVSATLVKTLPAGRANLLRAKSGQFQNFYFRVDSAPFDDVNVRQALRLLVDRQALVDVVYAGYGAVSNDVPGRYCVDYDDSLVRQRDVDQAKFLLKKAGKENLAVTLQTSTAIDGLVQAATLFKQQAQQAGVTVSIKQMDPAAYFDPTTNYGKMPFAQTYYFPTPSLEFIWNASFVSRGPTNETHLYNLPGFDRTQMLLRESMATDDQSKQTDIWRELQQQQFDQGGYINWGTADFLDAVATRVQGLTPSKYLNASGFNFRKAWIAG